MKRGILQHSWWLVLVLASCFSKPVTSSLEDRSSQDASSSSESVSSLSELPSSQEPSIDVTSSSSVSPVIRKQLALSYTEDTYYQYDTLNLSNLEVRGETYREDVLVSSEPVTSYVAIFSDSSELATSTYQLKKVGDRSLQISASGYRPTNLKIHVLTPTEFEQNLMITPPSKTTYALYDTMDFTGFSVGLHTKRTTEKEEPEINRTLSDEEYSFTIEGKAVKTPFYLDESGNYTFSISYAGFKGTITGDFTISVVKPDPSTPLIYSFDNLSYNEDTSSMKVTFANENVTLKDGDKGYYSPDEVTLGADNTDYAAGTQSRNLTPAKGKVPLLVVPVVLPGDEANATDANWNLIQRSFFGDDDDVYYESLRSYYYKSSYGQLLFEGVTADYFYPGQDGSLGLASSYAIGPKASVVRSIAKAIPSWLTTTYPNFSLDDYDSDDDGCLDTVWMVYLHAADHDKNFWAYTSWGGNDAGTKESPSVSTFGWMSYDFCRGLGISSVDKNGDAHTAIHETGHMMGLSDYYPTSKDTDSYYNAVGTYDMMSSNFLDHNPYSKLLLGWIKPYIVYGSCSIDLISSQNQNAAIVIPYDGKTYQKDSDGHILFNPFDEYLILDLYTPKNLNHNNYSPYGASYVNATGGRLYHVDSRLFRYGGEKKTVIFTYYDSTKAYRLLDDPDDVFKRSEFQAKSNYGYYSRCISNTKEGSGSEEAEYSLDSSMNAFDEIRWISADARYLSSKSKPNVASLFRPTSNPSFRMSAFQKSFPSSLSNTVDGTTTTTPCFDNQKTCSFSFTVAA